MQSISFTLNHQLMHKTTTTVAGKVTITRRLSQLIDQIENHPHKEEILRLALEQQMDDRCYLSNVSECNAIGGGGGH